MIHYVTTNGAANPWVANELRTVCGAGIPVRLHAMRSREVGFHRADWAAALRNETLTIYPLPPMRLARAVLLAPFRFGRRFFEALGNALFGSRESLRVRLTCLVHLLVACEWAGSLRDDPPTLIHSQWIHSCGTIGMYGAWLLGVPFSFTGHATDLFRDRCALRDKIRRARFIICISRFHRDFFLEEGARPEQLRIAHCGIDPALFPLARRLRQRNAPLRILSSGRLVEKKGFADLIDACDVLAHADVAFECVIAGSGPLEGELRARTERLGLADQVTITGRPLQQEEIADFMHGGDVYCLACVRAADGDIDGLPIMLMEAMACGVPVVSTQLVGIPDLVVDGETGLLVEPHDVPAIAGAIRRLAGDPALADRLARAGRDKVCREFDIQSSLNPLLGEFRRALEAG